MKKVILLIALCAAALTVAAQGGAKATSFKPAAVWPDDQGNHINAHGGGVMYYNGTYYWYGEHKGERGSAAFVGVTCYSSKDLYNWKYEGVAMPISQDPDSDITSGSTIERPKVIYNAKTKKFVMYFHLELKGKGYSAARRAVAVADKPQGPFTYLKSGRVNPGIWPIDMTPAQRQSTVKLSDFEKWWTPEWRKAIEEGVHARENFESGQMSRDMTLFVDDDGKAYHIYSAEENLTLNVAELTDDYLDYTGKYMRIAPGGHNEAPAIFKKDGKYYMITSGCTGWAPNAARQFTAPSIWGPWTQHDNPCVGDKADSTFASQSTYILPVQGKKNAFIFMADRWNPRRQIDARYIWLPIQFENGLPVLKWYDEWDLSFFDQINPSNDAPKAPAGYKLVWSDEFNTPGVPDPNFWSFEKGFVRNNEFQWYQEANATVNDGALTIQGRHEQLKNPNYDATSTSWQRNREYAEYTASSIKTVGKKEFQYGRFEIRAKIPAFMGSWPAIWTLGKTPGWPTNGEIDIMEWYQIRGVPHILANVAWGGGEGLRRSVWDTTTHPYSQFLEKDKYWGEKFHIWRMDWDEKSIRLYLDDVMLNETLTDVANYTDAVIANPFRQPHYILLNLAIGGNNGGTPDNTKFPLNYLVDYVRVYQK